MLFWAVHDGNRPLALGPTNPHFRAPRAPNCKFTEILARQKGLAQWLLAHAELTIAWVVKVCGIKAFGLTA